MGAEVKRFINSSKAWMASADQQSLALPRFVMEVSGTATVLKFLINLL